MKDAKRGALSLAFCGVVGYILTAAYLNGTYSNRPQDGTSVDCHGLNPSQSLGESNSRWRIDDPYTTLQNTQYHQNMFEQLELDDAQLLFHRLVTRKQYECGSVKRFGSSEDTGYDVCVAPPYLPKKNNCLVYSFGINNQWSFDEAVSTELGCEVHAFDPSMGMKDHMHTPKIHFHNLGLWGSNLTNHFGWDLASLSTIRNRLGHDNRAIDILKVDVEAAEWPFLRDAIITGVLRSVKQLLLEIHSPRWVVKQQTMSKTDYAEMYDIMWHLRKFGLLNFRHRHVNNCCGYFATLTPKEVLSSNAKLNLCCYELFYVNVNFYA